MIPAEGPKLSDGGVGCYWCYCQLHEGVNDGVHSVHFSTFPLPFVHQKVRVIAWY
jgi:hypothetical protein